MTEAEITNSPSLFYSLLDDGYWIFDRATRTRWKSRWFSTMPEYMTIDRYRSSVNPFTAWWLSFSYEAVEKHA